jgi:hypothetical protein
MVGSCHGSAESELPPCTSTIGLIGIMADATSAIYSAEVATTRIMAKMRLQLFEKSLDASGLRRAFAEADFSGSCCRRLLAPDHAAWLASSLCA